MALHLIKMAAGISSFQELRDRQDFIRPQHRKRLASFGIRGDYLLHVTRSFPKRRDEILADQAGVPGSLFWVFKKRIQARQKIADFIEVETEDGGKPRCGILLEGGLVPVQRQLRGAFQGWRYLEVEDSPADLSERDFDISLEKLHPKMRQDLEDLCLI